MAIDVPDHRLSDELWRVDLPKTPPVIGWFDAETGEAFPYYYTANEIGSRDTDLPSHRQPTGEVPAGQEEIWADDDGTEAHLTM